MTGISLRAPKEGDVPALTEMINLPGVRRGTLRLPYTTETFVRRRFIERGPQEHSIVAEIGGVLAGAGMLMGRSGRQSHTAQILLFVHDDHWRKGIGRALLSGLLDLADGWLGLLRVELDVDATNTAAISLYESAGFEREGLKRGDTITDGVLTDSLLMARLRPSPERKPS